MVKGNTAVVIGAMYAGCDCFFGYPITPASEILHEASKYFLWLEETSFRLKVKKPQSIWFMVHQVPDTEL